MTTFPNETITLIKHEVFSVSGIIQTSAVFPPVACYLPVRLQTRLTKESPLYWRLAPSSDSTFCLCCSSNLMWILKPSERKTLFSLIFITISMCNYYKLCSQFANTDSGNSFSAPETFKSWQF